LFFDVRQLLAYIKDSHGAVFRRVLLSGLLDAATWLQQNVDDSSPDNGRIYRYLSVFELFKRTSDYSHKSIGLRMLYTA
jgi:hypothetical protein